MSKFKKLAIGIDIGGTGIKGSIVDINSGKLIGNRFRKNTPVPANPKLVLKVILDIFQSLKDQSESKIFGNIENFGITFPGIVKNGTIYSAPNVDKSWIGVNFKNILKKVTNIEEVFVINDADAAGLAETYYGAGKEIKGVVLVITLGTGIGSAYLINGRLAPNAELGHIELDGQIAELRASAAARERDNISWKQYSARLRRYFKHLELIFSPNLFIVGGGISRRTNDFLPNLKIRTKIVPAFFQNNSGIVGASLYSLNKQKKFV